MEYNGTMADFSVEAHRVGVDAYVVNLIIHTNEVVATTTTFTLDNKLYERLFDTVKDIINGNS